MKHADLRSIRWVFAYCLAALAVLMVTAGSPVRASAPAPDQAASQFEVRFMQEMIDHHMMAVEMSNTCLAKAVHQELRALCQEIITEQQQEISTMQQWLGTWYGISNYQPRMHPGQHMHRLSMLNNAEYEIEFMQQMIRHHRTAVVMASPCVDRAYHPDLQDTCEGIITSQLAEIQMMQDWLCTWYGLCRPRHQR